MLDWVPHRVRNSPAFSSVIMFGANGETEGEILSALGSVGRWAARTDEKSPSVVGLGSPWTIKLIKKKF